MATVFALAAAMAMAAAAAPNVDLGVSPEVHAGETRCGACHTTAGWQDVTFAHDRTGFPLSGRHRAARCEGCHAGGRFGQHLPRACAGCHRDVHAGRAGPGCDRCHDTEGWQQEALGPEAHRRTAFPLLGRHAVLPCEECHGDRRDRAFARPTPRCVACHELDYGPRATAAGVDHLAVGFGEECRECHGPWRFSPARWAAHDACFQITVGPHSGIRCRACHDVTLPSIPPGGALTCSSGTADCLRCHTMPGIEAAHAGVAGFQPYNDRCYECHRMSGG